MESPTCRGLNTSNQTTVPAGLTNVAQVSAGWDTTCARKTDGSIVCWGANDQGQATPPAGLTGTTDVAAGYQNACVALPTSNGPF